MHHPRVMFVVSGVQGGFPANTVVTRLAWGFIDPTLAQRILEADKVE